MNYFLNCQIPSCPMVNRKMIVKLLIWNLTAHMRQSELKNAELIHVTQPFRSFKPYIITPTLIQNVWYHSINCFSFCNTIKRRGSVITKVQQSGACFDFGSGGVIAQSSRGMPLQTPQRNNNVPYKTNTKFWGTKCADITTSSPFVGEFRLCTTTETYLKCLQALPRPFFPCCCWQLPGFSICTGTHASM